MPIFDPPVRLLAIDPGKNFGLASFKNDLINEVTDFESVARATMHTRLSLLDTRLNNTDILVVEDVVKGASNMKSWEAIWHTVGLQYYLVETAMNVNNRIHSVYQVAPQTLKKYIRQLLGADASYKPTKNDSVDLANKFYGRDLRYKDHNQAEAVLLGRYALENLI